MDWNLPLTVTIDGNEHEIRNKCEHRTILDCLVAYNDLRLPDELRVKCATTIFYKNIDEIENKFEAAKEMLRIINIQDKTKENTQQDTEMPIKIINWKKDYHLIAPPVSRILGYSVRDKNRYTHWYDFIGAFNEIGDCYLTQILNVRLKRKKGKRLNELETEFYRTNKKDIDLPMEMSDEEKEWLDDDW